VVDCLFSPARDTAFCGRCETWRLTLYDESAQAVFSSGGLELVRLQRET
jgi:hypothetical protein